MRAFGPILRSLRLARGLTIPDAARSSGVDHGTWRNYEQMAEFRGFASKLQLALRGLHDHTPLTPGEVRELAACVPSLLDQILPAPASASAPTLDLARELEQAIGPDLACGLLRSVLRAVAAKVPDEVRALIAVRYPDADGRSVRVYDPAYQPRKDATDADAVPPPRDRAQDGP